MIFFSDEVLETITDYFRMNEVEKNLFIESIRSQQLEIFWQAFIIYYDTHKNELERQHLSNITKDVDVSKTGQQKLMELMRVEVENNPECLEFILKKMTQFVTNIVYEFTSIADDETAKKIAQKLFINSDVLQSAIENKALDIDKLQVPDKLLRLRDKYTPRSTSQDSSPK